MESLAKQQMLSKKIKFDNSQDNDDVIPNNLLSSEKTKSQQKIKGDQQKIFTCDNCSFQNAIERSFCQICEMPNPIKDNKEQINNLERLNNSNKTEIPNGFEQIQTNKKSQEDNIQVKVKKNEDQTIHLQEDKKKTYICSECTFQNSIQNKKCEICEALNPHYQEEIQFSQKQNNESEQQIGKQKSRDTFFICPECCFQNKIDVEACEICSATNPNLLKQLAEQEKTKNELQPKLQFKCQNCNHVNDYFNDSCVFCQETNPRIIDKLKEEEEKIRKLEKSFGQKWIKLFTEDYICESCGFKNDKFNETCVACEATHPKLLKAMIEEIEQSGNLSAECKICKKKISLDELDAHEESCGKEEKVLKEKKDIALGMICEENLSRMSLAQIQCIVQQQIRGKDASDKQRDELLKRIKKCGYNEEDLPQLEYYIKEMAPIVIHVNLQIHIGNFLKDTHYRNVFEIQQKLYNNNIPMKGGRFDWEKRLFGSIYDKISHFERVKYGTLNFLNDKQGVQCAYGYGNCYFQLKYQVRERCTVTSCDSAAVGCSVGTLANCLNVINSMNDTELKGCLNAANERSQSSKIQSCYKELQYHGPIEFSKDIETVFVNSAIKQQNEVISKIEEFCLKNNCKLDYF